MKTIPKQASVATAVLMFFWLPFGAAGQSCGDCHTDEYAKWIHSVHANTQLDVANELSQSDTGLSPDEVIQGEDCIACHAPTAVLASGGIGSQMTEAQALNYFFTTSNGVFTAGTVVTNTADWPHVDCATCHDPMSGALSYFNSQTGQWEAMTNASELCGQCHGNLHFASTDHQVLNGWMMSKHANTQVHVAGELRDSHPGESPDEVIQGEDCIACHAPTAVLANGGMTEAQALGYFFTTNSSGVFSADTTVTNTADWPQVECVACHDPHDAGKYSYFNSATRQYEVMTNADELCGQCHGNLRFPDTDHLSYNIESGTGGIGVPNQQLMPGVSCVACHMYASDVDGSNSKMYGGHTWAITVPEAGGADTVSCLVCHTGADEAAADNVINGFQGQFQTLDAATEASVNRAATALGTTQNTNWLASLAEAEHNLTYAESDESGGFHNYSYLMALLNNANTIALSFPIVDMALQGTNVVVSWTGTGTLQSASSIVGPWNDVPNAPNPLVIPPAAQAPQQFYRLRQ